jgi:glyoxylase-like metal-dependent hydrolase (beta-lactamase superfamily II)
VATIERVDEHVWVTRVSLDDYDVRGALVLGQRRAVIWDTLSRPRDMRPFVPLIGGRELTVVYSHADWDHIWGTAGLEHAGVPILAHQACADRFGTDVPAALSEMRRSQPGRWDDVVLVPPTETFVDRCSLDLGGITLMLSHLPGHTADCIVGLIPERGVLLAGDTVETPFPVVPADSPLDAWIDRLGEWSADERVALVVPAHGRIGSRTLLQHNIDYLQALRDGRPRPPNETLTAFYRDTHQANMRWEKRAVQSAAWSQRTSFSHA